MTAIDRVPATPPEILPVPNDVVRPLWSVMIPVYNCTEYIEAAINSVLQQYPGEDKMHIEVIDDCSTDADVGALVERVGKGKVQYFRKEKNMGSIRNFETCVSRSKGHYVHILHGDDFVLDGFYAEIERLFETDPTAGAAFTDFNFVNEEGEFLYSEVPLQDNDGIVEDALGKLAVKQLIQPPAMVIKRSVYENIGSYYAVLNCEDWLMWARVAAQYPILYSRKHLACYRKRTNNLTHDALTNGRYVIDLRTVMNIIETLLPPERRKELIKKQHRHFSIYQAWISHLIYHNYKNKQAALDMVKSALSLDVNFTTLKLASKLWFKALIGYKQ